MGLSIHYRGRISNVDRIVELRRYLYQFAKQVEWQRLDLTGLDDSRMLEIILYPPGGCEPVFFLFDSQGYLRPPDAPRAGERNEPLWCSVETAYGPLDAHVQIVELLRQIQREFIPGLEVADETGYWETENLEKLRSARRRLRRRGIGPFRSEPRFVRISRLA